jgi:hypothetical protein
MVPEVTFSPRLQPPQASVRPAGKDYQYFYQTWTNQQWLALIGLLSGSDSTNWPDRSDIDIAARRLREKDWSIVVSCPGVTNGVLMGLVFDAENSGFLHVWREWTRHPDGRSWVHEWKPSTTHIALLIGDAHLLCCRADMLREEYAKKADDLARVKDLGEISAEEFLSKLAALQEETRQRVCKWVSQDAESEIARLQDLARRERKRDGDILAAEDIRLMESYGLNVWLAKEKRRQLGAGTEKEWVAAVQEYRDSTPSFDLDAMVMSAEVAGDFGIEDQPPSGPGRRLVGAWKILRVEGVDSGRSDSTLVIVFGEQYDVRMVYQEVGKRKPRTLTIDGSYDLAGSTLYLDMEDSAENDPFVLWYEGQNLVMQQFDSRWIFTPFTE